jgi:hypothetical protein
MTEREKVTAEQFFELPETNRVIELVNGKITTPATQVTQHQRIILRTARHIEDVMPDGEVFTLMISTFLSQMFSGCHRQIRASSTRSTSSERLI